jgi:hypothetical protein
MMSATAVLVIVIAWGGYEAQSTKYPFQSMEQCLAVLAVTEIKLPKHADENEWIAFKTCYPKN